MTARPAFDEPFDVQIIEDEVVIVGPGGVGASLTMAAAQESMRRLSAALGGMRRPAARKRSATAKLS